MKSYAYTAKANNGSLRRGTLSAADRAAALEALRSHGLIPISVKEATAERRHPLPPRALAYAAAALVLLAAGGLWLTLSRCGTGRDGSPNRPQTTQRSSHTSGSARRAETTSTTQTVDVAAAGRIDKPVSPPETARRETPAVPAAPAVLPAATQSARSAAAPAAEQPEEEKKKEPLFKYETEQMLALYVNPGVIVPPTPVTPGFEQDLLESLKTDIVITSKDTQEDIQKKELVAWMKEDLRKHIANGGSVDDYFAIVEKRQEEEAELLQEAHRIIYVVDKEGNTKETLEAHRLLNEALKEKGIAPLPMPGNLRRTMK